MTADRPPDDERRVLVLAPTGRDAANSVDVLARAGLVCEICRDLGEVCRAIDRGAGALLLTEEALGRDAAGALRERLLAQPSWSDLPIVLLTKGGPESPAAVRAMDELGNVILLERPVRVRTLVTAARTALRAREKQYEVRRQLFELRQADLRKDEFLATLAHELRNPLAPLRTGLQILRADPRSPGAARVQDMLERQLAHMVRLIDDLMDVSRITRGKVELRRQRIDLRQVIESAVEASGPALERAKHTFHLSVPPAPLPVDGDPTRLAQVISNLLNNAAKYTPNGGQVWLSAERVDANAVVRVRDDGVGIPADLLPVVFDLFIQGRSAHERSQGGLGIGLTLVRSLVEMHGGDVSARSDGAGAGSEFTLRLPLATPSEPRSPGPSGDRTPDAPLQRSARVLVVDDNEDAADSLSLYLEQTGYDTRVAHRGDLALELVRVFHPEVVFLDLGLPEMSGYDVARSLRQGGSDAVLVALTGWGSPADRDRSRAAGFDYHLTKPADLRDVQRILAQVAARA